MLYECVLVYQACESDNPLDCETPSALPSLEPSLKPTAEPSHVYLQVFVFNICV